MTDLKALLRGLVLVIGLLALIPAQMAQIVPDADPAAAATSLQVSASQGSQGASAVGVHRRVEAARPGSANAVVAPSGQDLPDDGGVPLLSHAAALSLDGPPAPVSPRLSAPAHRTLSPPRRPPKIG